MENSIKKLVVGLIRDLLFKAILISAIAFFIGYCLFGAFSDDESSSNKAKASSKSALDVESTTSDTGEVTSGGEGTLGTVTLHGKTFNLFLQTKGSWAGNAYGRGKGATMSSSGCGPTAEAIIASAYDSSFTPETARADIVKANGGTISNYSNAQNIAASLKRLVPGIKVETAAYSEEKIIDCLKKGGQVWVVVANCKYTGNAHCMALIGYNSEKGVYVAHGSASGRPYGWDDLSYITQYHSHEVIAYVYGVN